MKKILIISLLFFTNLSANDFKLDRVVKGFGSPWSLTFIDNTNLFITEKAGNIKFVNLKEKTIRDINHNLNVLEDGPPPITKTDLSFIKLKSISDFIKSSSVTSDSPKTSLNIKLLKKAVCNFLDVFTQSATVE